ncbi:polyamine-modulated factor 1-binding protein 1-like [Hemiscyllium ocellatum]|uniref:polyamine-modulated factor 1-binding protein 1-like n=1 Tax=Hemiscyllium ocellatum TaxID=170820 RepID=UPI002966875D|nr:polyamine-modulated factor 1-binding protein 1-like [Hemiscyllium ocellatum]
MSGRLSKLSPEKQISDCFGLMVQSHINVENFLLPTIASITVLSDLVRQVRKINDVKLKQSSSDKKSLFSNPESFKSCLMKICNETINSLDATSNNLRNIQRSCKQLKGSLQAQPSAKQLARVKVCVDQCKENAASVEQRLSELSGLYNELLEMCEASQIASQDQLGEIRKLLEKNRERKKAIEQEKIDLDKKWSEVSQEHEQLLNKYNDVSSSAQVDEFCEEGLKKMMVMIPEIMDLLSNLSNPLQLAVMLAKGLMFLITLINNFKNKKASESNLEISEFLSEVREQAELKIQQVRAELEKSQDKYKACSEEMKRLDEESEQLSREIQDTQTQEESVKTNLQLMVEGLKVLGKVQSNWADMIKFIQLVPKLTESCLSTFTKFGAGGEAGSQRAAEILASNQIQVSQAVSISDSVGALSETYVQIYQDHLKEPLGELSSLLGGQGSDDTFKGIQRKCEAAKQAARSKVTQNQEEFTKNGEEAINKLPDLLK